MLHLQIHNYKIISLLGEGGMANVYLAENQVLGNQVALKLLKEEFVQHPNIRKRFLAEARNLAQMSHLNVIKVTDLIDAGDIVAFVMEYIEGETLEDYIERKGKLPDEEIETLFKQMMEAIEYVHLQGFIHRDIKPSNFMLTKNGSIKLLDFGIAKNTNDSAVDYTKTGLMQQMGTPMYMSPEQVKNTSEVTKETDIYSLGVVLWQMVTGKKPYDSNKLSLPEIQVAILKEQLPLTNTVWDSTIEQATEKATTKRSFKINKIKIMESKSVSETEIDPVIPRQNSYKPKPRRIAYFNFKTISIAIGILLFFGIIIINMSKDSDASNVTIPDDPKPRIVLPTKKEPVLKKVEPITIEPNQNPKEKQIESVKVTPIVSSSNLKIGQKYQGGIIFYLDNSGKHGKVCSESDIGKFDWGSAMKECQNLNLNGYSDWYLPSIDELKLLYDKPGLIFNDFYLSCTEFGSNGDVWLYYFGSGACLFYNKDVTAYVRAVRAF